MIFFLAAASSPKKIRKKKPTSACPLLRPQTRRSRPAASWFPCRRGRRSRGGPSVASWCWSSWWCCCWCCCSSTGGGRRTNRATRPPSPSPPAAPSTPSTPSQVQCKELPHWVMMRNKTHSFSFIHVFFKMYFIHFIFSIYFFNRVQF